MTTVESAPIGELAERVDKEGEVEADDGLTVIPGSYCMGCGGSGTTRLMLTKIPYFREVIVSSFECGDCGDRNTEVQFGGEIQEKGCRFVATCRTAADLNRQVIKSDNGVVRVPSLSLEIPAATQRGTISTIEGVLKRAADELEALQPARRAADAAQAAAVQGVVDGLRRCLALESPFDFCVEDASGNSFVEKRGVQDPDVSCTLYERSAAEDVSIGLHEGGVAPASGQPVAAQSKTIEGLDPTSIQQGDPTTKDVMTFPVDCPNCRRPGSEHMCVANIPHFKECILMSFVCETCGFRNSEIKGGGAVPAKGLTATLLVLDPTDLSRDILKSDTASLELPDLDLGLAPGTLGGVYTSVEGLLQKIKANLDASDPFSAADSDSADLAKRNTMTQLLAKLDDLAQARIFPFTLVLTDPLANSFIGPRRDLSQPHDPLQTIDDATNLEPNRDQLDPLLLVSEYVRSWDEDEDLGLHDIRTGDDGSKPQDTAPHIGPDPNMKDHPDPEFARGCDDATGHRPDLSEVSATTDAPSAS